MLAIDTNVLVRIATHDTPEEAAAVARAIAGQRVFVAKTVLLETDWVLRSFYSFSAMEVRDFMQSVVHHPDYAVEDWQQVFVALEAVELGLEFADALHLASAENRPFLTLDKALNRRMPDSTTLIKPERRPKP